MMNRTLILVFAFLLSGINSNAQKLQLIYNPEPGDAYTTDMKIQTSIDQEVMGIDQSIQMVISMQMKSSTLPYTSEKIPMNFQYSHLEIKMTSAMGEFTLNSDDENDNPGNIFIKAMTGKDFKIIFNKDGSINEIDGVEKIIEGLEEISEMDEQMRASIKQNLKQSFGKESLMDNLQNINIIYPEERIKEGDTWNYGIKTSNRQADLIFQNHVEVIEIKKETVLLRIKSEIESPDKGFQEINGNQFKIRLDGSQIGETVIERKTGMNIESTVNQTINGMMLMKSGSDSEDILEIPMTIKTQMNLTSVQDN